MHFSGCARLPELADVCWSGVALELGFDGGAEAVEVGGVSAFRVVVADLYA